MPVLMVDGKHDPPGANLGAVLERELHRRLCAPGYFCHRPPAFGPREADPPTSRR